MFSIIVDAFLQLATLVLWTYNLFFFLKGRILVGKIGRSLGSFGYITLMLAILSMAFSDLIVGGGTLLGKAAIVLNFIIAVDNFLNGNDPPKHRRRVWLKNKFAKLVPTRSS